MCTHQPICDDDKIDSNSRLTSRLPSRSLPMVESMSAMSTKLPDQPDELPFGPAPEELRLNIPLLLFPFTIDDEPNKAEDGSKKSRSCGNPLFELLGADMAFTPLAVLTTIKGNRIKVN